MAKFKTKKKPRNAGGPRKFKMPSDWMSNGIASVLGGGGGALLGGVLAREEIIKPETTGLMLTVGGLVGGALTSGPTRTAMNGLAGAGAGQLALAHLANRSAPPAEPRKVETAPAPVATPAPSALPAPSGQPASSLANAYGGGHGSVWSAFRDAAGELEWMDDGYAEDHGAAEGWEVYDE